MEICTGHLAKRSRVERSNPSVTTCKALEIVLEHWLAPVVVVSFEELESTIEKLKEEFIHADESVKRASSETNKRAEENRVRKWLIKNSTILDLSRYESKTKSLKSNESEISSIIQNVRPLHCEEYLFYLWFP